MKMFHTADWHLGKLIQGIYMTEDQRYILNEFISEIEKEKPDVVIIAGDLYDRAVPPTDAVALLDESLERIVVDLQTPVIAIAGNHDSPLRLHFGSQIMKSRGLHITGHIDKDMTPVILNDIHGEVHFHLIPFADPSVIRHVFGNEDVRTHNDAMQTVIDHIKESMDPNARHVCIGHAFVTPRGEPKENTSDSERPLSIGGAEHVDARHFQDFHYTALGHLHQAHHVGDEQIRYAGSPMKYSISEENHKKGFFIVDVDQSGMVTVEKRHLEPRRDIRTVKAKMADILSQTINEDYVFVKLLDETPILAPMEKIRSVYPNAMHIERNLILSPHHGHQSTVDRHKMDDLTLFKAFYQEVHGSEVSDEMTELFEEVLNDVLGEERMRS